MKRSLLLLSLLLALVLILSGCGGSLRVKVLSPEETPVEGVMLVGCRDTLCETKTTESDGTAVFSTVPDSLKLYGLPEGMASPQQEYQPTGGELVIRLVEAQP